MMRFFILFTTFLGSGFSEEVDLRLFEKSIYSQNGEDGVIAKIFELIGTDSKYCVEFGAFNGIDMSNTNALRTQKGWKALLLDGSFEDPSLNLHKEFVTKDNINALFHKYEVPLNLDFLSIDIDYNDFYVWQALDSCFEAKVVVIEFNATHLPNEDKVVLSAPLNYWDGTNYFGASILALYNLGREKGYSLVYGDSCGVNLFFIKDAVLEEKGISFKNMNNVEKLYQPPQYGSGPNGGHPQDPKNRPYISSSELLE